MQVTGKLIAPQYAANGKLRLVVEVNEKKKALEEIDKILDVDIDISLQKHKNHRSNDANAYFWKLIDSISKVLMQDKWAVYLLELSKWGVFDDVIIKEFALPGLQAAFRYTEVLDTREDEYDEQIFNWLTVRCYYGSSKYNSKEMSDLISGTVADAKDLGIETLPPAEIERMIAAMKEAE